MTVPATTTQISQERVLPDRPIRVFLLDGHEVVRRGVAEMLEAAGELSVVGEASNAADALHVARNTSPDVAVLDVRLAGATASRSAGAFAMSFPMCTV